MKEFISNILPRIQKFSAKLDQKENFIEKPWVLLEEGKNEMLEMEFFRDGKLIVSHGGDATWGTWQLTPSNQRLILDYSSKTLMLQTAFINDAILIAKKSGSTQPTLFFVNQEKIPDLNVEAYLDEISKKEEPKILKKPEVQVQIKEEKPKEIKPEVMTNNEGLSVGSLIFRGCLILILTVIVLVTVGWLLN
jgi:hypothetical protein